MNIDDAPDELEAFFDRVRAAHERETGKVQKAVAALNAEKVALTKSLTDLQAQCKSARDQLAATMSDLGRAAGLVGINTEIAEKRKTLDAVNAEIEQRTEVLAAATKERTEEEAKANAARDELSQQSAVRAFNQEQMAKMRHQLGVS
jgi:chromosome segregation ATPase